MPRTTEAEFQTEVTVRIKSGQQAVHIPCFRRDHELAARSIAQAAATAGYYTYYFNLSEGFKNATPMDVPDKAGNKLIPITDRSMPKINDRAVLNLLAALECIQNGWPDPKAPAPRPNETATSLKLPERCVIVMRGVSESLLQSVPTRNHLCEQIASERLSVQDSRHPIFLVTYSGETALPTPVLSHIDEIRYYPPDEDILSDRVDAIMTSLNQAREKRDPPLPPLPPIETEVKHKFVQALKGLSRGDATDVLAIAASRSNGLNESALHIVQERKDIVVAQSSVLRPVPWERIPQRNQIAGMDLLLPWMEEQSLAFTDKARKLKVDRPRGILLAGVTGCVAEGTLILDPVTGQENKVEELALKEHMHPVLSLTDKGLVVCKALPPKYLGEAQLYRVTLDNGKAVTVTSQHRFLTPTGWLTLADGLIVGHFLAVADAIPGSYSSVSLSAREQGVPHSTRIPEGHSGHWSPGRSDSCDEQPQPGEGNDQVPSPSQVYARERSLAESHVGVSVSESERTHHHPQSDPLSRSSSSPEESPSHVSISDPDEPYVFLLSDGSLPEQQLSHLLTSSRPQGGEEESHRWASGSSVPSTGYSLPENVTVHRALSGFLECGPLWSDTAQPSQAPSSLNGSPQLCEGAVSSPVGECASLSCNHVSRWNRVLSVVPVGLGKYYDLHVPGVENYVAEGIVHHNCGKSRAAYVWSRITGMRLYELKLSRVKRGLVGASEQLLREVLATLDSVGEFILLINEIEKDLTGGSKNSSVSDGGVMRGLVGELIDWWSEYMERGTVVATCNSLQNMDAEILDRFTKLWGIGLPSPAERWDIARIYCAEHDIKLERLEGHREDILDACHNFTGRNLVDAIGQAHVMSLRNPDNGKFAVCGQPTIEQIITAMKRTKPTIDKDPEGIKAQIRLAQTQCDPASKSLRDWREDNDDMPRAVGRSVEL